MEENADRPLFPNEPPENRKKNGVPAIIPPVVWLLIIFLAGLILGNLLWLVTSDVLAFGREDLSVEITVSDGDSIKDIAQDLKDQGLVRYAWLFRLYAKATNAKAKIRPGTYTLSTRYDYPALIKALSAGTVSRSASTFQIKELTDRKWQNWNY